MNATELSVIPPLTCFSYCTWYCWAHKTWGAAISDLRLLTTEKTHMCLHTQLTIIQDNYVQRPWTWFKQGIRRKGHITLGNLEVTQWKNHLKYLKPLKLKAEEWLHSKHCCKGMKLAMFGMEWEGNRQWQVELFKPGLCCSVVECQAINQEVTAPFKFRAHAP